MHRFTVRFFSRVWHRFRFCANQRRSSGVPTRWKGSLSAHPPQSQPSHLRPASSSTAAAGMHLSHVLLNGDLMKRPQPLAHGASRCSPVVPPSAEELHEARNPPPPPETQTKLKKQNKTNSVGTNNPLGLSLLDLITKGSLGDITGSSCNKFEATCREDENPDPVTRQQGTGYLGLSTHG